MQLNTNLPKHNYQVIKSGPISREINCTSEIDHSNFEVGSWKSQLRGGRLEVRTQKSEAGTRDPELGSQKSEVATQKSELRSQTSEVRSPSSAFITFTCVSIDL